MGQLLVITGGTRSGKSLYAERCMEHKERVLYIATARITDEEMRHRVQLHQARRGERYTTHEGYKDLAKVIDRATCPTLFECVGTWLTNRMFDMHHNFDSLSSEDVSLMEEALIKEMDAILESISQSAYNHVVITNEVGWSLVSDYRLGRIFTDIQGRLNQRLAAHAQKVVLMVSGIPVPIKGEESPS